MRLQLARALPAYDVFIIAVMMLVFSLVFFQINIDDAYITFRYGANWAAFSTWNWNPEGERVEAYTNFSYALLSIIPHALNISTYLFMKLVGLVCFILLLLRVRALCDHDPWLRLLASLMVVANPYLYIHVFSGLETPLYMLLLLELFVQTGRLMGEAGKHRPSYHAALLLLLPLTRPDGAIFSVVSLGVWFYFQRGQIFKCLMLWLCGLLALAYMAWRIHYFGHLLPNTFYLKSGLSAGLIESVFNLTESRMYLAAIAVSVWCIRAPAYRVVAAAAVLTHLLAYVDSKLAMNYADRFFLQLYVPVLLYGAHFVARGAVAKWPPVSISAYLVMGILHILPCYDSNKLYEMMVEWNKTQDSYRHIGQGLAPYRDQSYRLMVAEAGSIPYYSGWQTIDFGGLADVTIAHHGNSMSYMEQVSPDVIILYATGYGEDSLLVQARDYHVIDEYIRQSGLYEYAGTVRTSDKHYMAFYVKHSIGDAGAIKAVTRQLIERGKSLYDRRDVKGAVARLIRFEYASYPNP